MGAAGSDACGCFPKTSALRGPLKSALIGTTEAPWQLFFQQSNVVDKRITARWLRYELADTIAGPLLFAFGAVAILVACALAFAAAPPRRLRRCQHRRR